MPEGRRAPWKYLPRPGARLSVTFGAPLARASVRANLGAQQSESEQLDVEKTRISLTELVQRAVEDVGRQVSGDLLDGVPHQRT
jgi:monolysocardiolipin acyltransferase